MAENYLRQSPLAHLNPGSRAKFSDTEGNPGLIIEEQKDLTLLVIRGDPKNKKLVTKIKSVIGLPLPKPLSYVEGKGRRILWMGPDEFLIMAPQNEFSLISDQIIEFSKNQGYATADISDSLCILGIRGKFARETLMKGCSLDFISPDFSIGSVVSTIFEKMPITIIQLNSIAENNVFQILLNRSYAHHFWLWLEASSKEYFEIQ